jgi:hypothetical protein
VTSLIDMGFVVDNAQADATPYFLRVGPPLPKIRIVEGPPPPLFVVESNGSVRLLKPGGDIRSQRPPPQRRR